MRWLAHYKSTKHKARRTLSSYALFVVLEDEVNVRCINWTMDDMICVCVYVYVCSHRMCEETLSSLVTLCFAILAAMTT